MTSDKLLIQLHKKIKKIENECGTGIITLISNCSISPVACILINKDKVPILVNDDINFKPISIENVINKLKEISSVYVSDYPNMDYETLFELFRI